MIIGFCGGGKGARRAGLKFLAVEPVIKQMLECVGRGRFGVEFGAVTRFALGALLL